MLPHGLTCIDYFCGMYRHDLLPMDKMKLILNTSKKHSRKNRKKENKKDPQNSNNYMRKKEKLNRNRDQEKKYRNYNKPPVTQSIAEIF